MRRHGRCSIGRRHAFVGISRTAVGRRSWQQCVFLVLGWGIGERRVSECIFSAEFLVVVVVVVSAAAAAALALPKRPSASSSLSSFQVGLPSFGCGLFFQSSPLPSFSHSPVERGDGLLGGPLASAKGTRAPHAWSGARVRPLAGDRAVRGVWLGWYVCQTVTQVSQRRA